MAKEKKIKVKKKIDWKHEMALAPAPTNIISCPFSVLNFFGRINHNVKYPSKNRENNKSTGPKSCSNTFVDTNVVPHIRHVTIAAICPVT